MPWDDLGRVTVRRRFTQEAPYVMSMLPLVAAGIGISIVPASLQHMNIRGVAYRGLTGSTQLKVPIRY
jgi:DNA-binding transcriptional LysR family regulator